MGKNRRFKREKYFFKPFEEYFDDITFRGFAVLLAVGILLVGVFLYVLEYFSKPTFSSLNLNLKSCLFVLGVCVIYYLLLCLRKLTLVRFDFISFLTLFVLALPYQFAFANLINAYILPQEPICTVLRIDNKRYPHGIRHREHILEVRYKSMTAQIENQDLFDSLEEGNTIHVYISKGFLGYYFIEE